jgi:hypothetical protein
MVQDPEAEKEATEPTATQFGGVTVIPAPAPPVEEDTEDTSDEEDVNQPPDEEVLDPDEDEETDDEEEDEDDAVDEATEE